MRRRLRRAWSRTRRAGGEVLRTVGDELQLAGLDLGAVLLALEVAQAGHQLVGGAVEALGLGVDHVDEAPEQALALVAELRAVRADALGEDAEGFVHRVDGVVGIPDVAGVELVALGRLRRRGPRSRRLPP